MRKVVYIVHEAQWEYNDEWFYREGENPVKAFANPDSAERFRRKKEGEARANLMRQDLSRNWDLWNQNLYLTFGSLEAITSLSPAELNRRLHSMGLPTYPKDDRGDEFHNRWWEALWAKRSMTEGQEEIWALFDKIRFYEITPMEVELS